MKRRKGLLDEEKFLPPLPEQLPRGVSSLPGYGQMSPVAQGLLGFTGRNPTYSVMDPEAVFQKWIRSTDWFKEFVNEYGEEPDLNSKDYDYRAAWRAGIIPERDPYDKNRFHWPSSLPSGEMLKSSSHPTAWKEYFMRVTGINPDSLNIKTSDEANTFLKNKTQVNGKPVVIDEEELRRSGLLGVAQ